MKNCGYSFVPKFDLDHHSHFFIYLSVGHIIRIYPRLEELGVRVIACSTGNAEAARKFKKVSLLKMKIFLLLIFVLFVFFQGNWISRSFISRFKENIV